MEEYVSRKVIAAKLGVGYQTIRNYEKKGMPVYKPGGDGRPKYKESEVEEWMKKVEGKP